MRIGDYDVHPVAECIPVMDEAEYVALKADIKANGLNEPIWLFRGKVLDGRHRLRACVELRIEPRFRAYEGDSPAEFAWSENGMRRHWSAGQRAIYATSYAKQVGNLAEVTRQEIAERSGVSERTAGDVKLVVEKGTPELIKAVESGEMSANAAAERIRQPGRKQEADPRVDARTLARALVRTIDELGGSTKYVNTTADNAMARISYGGRVYLLELTLEQP